MADVLDAVVVGAGPGGLTGAIYLGRFLRRFAVLHSGRSRAGWIPASHNHPGFPDEIGGPDLLARMTEQACRYGAEVTATEVTAAAHGEDGLFTLTTRGGELVARNVLLATGTLDSEPALPNVFDAVQRGLLRVCPICDAYEVRGKSIGVLGHSEFAVQEALFLRTYSERITILHVGAPETLSDAARRDAAEAGIEVIDIPIRDVVLEGDRIAAFDLEEGVTCRFDTVYSAMGCTPQSGLADELGAKLGDDRRLVVDDHQMTSVPGLFAAGDMVRGLNQISVAQAEAAIAATAIHKRLRLGD